MPTRILSRAVCGIAALLCGTLLPPAGVAEDKPAANSFRLRDVSGRESQGVLTSLTMETVTLGGAANTSRATTDVVSLLREPLPEPVPLAATAVLLANGDQLQLRPLSISDGVLQAGWTASPAWPPVEIPLETIRAVLLAYPREANAAAGLLAELLDRPHPTDALLLINGDTVQGELESLSEGTFTLGTDAGAVQVAAGGVRAVVLGTDLISFPPVGPRTVQLTLNDGSWITATGLEQGEAGKVQIEAAFGGQLTVPLASIVAVQPQHERVTPLAAITPSRYTFTPFLSSTWPLMTDRAVNGGFLTTAQRVFPRGLGLHSQSRVTWNLNGDYAAFEASIGLDDTAPRQASTRARVLVDDREVWTSPELTPVTGVVSLPRISLAGAQRLTLVVDFGRAGDIGDRVNWLNPVLIRGN